LFFTKFRTHYHLDVMENIYYIDFVLIISGKGHDPSRLLMTSFPVRFIFDINNQFYMFWQYNVLQISFRKAFRKPVEDIVQYSMSQVNAITGCCVSLHVQHIKYINNSVNRYLSSFF